MAAIRKLASEAGRDPAAILIFAMMTVILAPTDSEAQAKLADYRRYADPEGALTLMSGWTGVDFSRFDPDQVVEHVNSEAGRTAMENITRADPGRRLDRAGSRGTRFDRRHWPGDRGLSSYRCRPA